MINAIETCYIKTEYIKYIYLHNMTYCVINILVNGNFWFTQNITFKSISLNLNFTTELIFVKQEDSTVRMFF